MNNEYSAQVDRTGERIMLRKNVKPRVGATLSFRKIFVGSAWRKGLITNIQQDGKLVINTDL